MSSTGVNCPSCRSHHVKKTDIGYQCESCSTEFVVHSEDKKIVVYDLPPETINPPRHMIADGDVVRCTMCGKLFKNVYGATHWCGDYRNHIEHAFVWFNNFKLAKRCESCGCWVYPSLDHCNNQQCNDFGNSPILYIQKKDGDKWEEYTPIPDPPTPSPPPPTLEPKKFGCGCGTVTGIIATLVVVFILIVGVFNIWSDRQRAEVFRKEHERVMAIRPWDNNPGMSQVVFDDLSKDRQDFYWQYTGRSESNWVVNKEYYSMKDGDNTRAEVRIEVKPSRPGDFKGISLHSTWVRDGERWSLVKDSTYLLYTP